MKAGERAILTGLQTGTYTVEETKPSQSNCSATKVSVNGGASAESLTANVEVTETSTLFGFTDNPYPHFKEADFYVLSSRYEGFPTVLFEAITLKKKIIATEVSGVSEMLEYGKLGLMVENSEEGIYSGMKKALEKPEFFDEYKRNLNNYEMPFTLENSVKSIREIIDNL